MNKHASCAPVNENLLTTDCKKFESPLRAVLVVFILVCPFVQVYQGTTEITIDLKGTW